LLTRLIRHEHDGRQLAATELVENCIFILNAGHETTTNLIGNALEIFIRFRPSGAPDRESIADEERGRGSAAFESSNQLGNRIVTAPTLIGDVPCRRGRWSPSVSGGEPRPDAFADPDRFDVARNPTRHLASVPASTCAPAEPGAARRPHRDRAFPGGVFPAMIWTARRAQPPRALPRLRVAARGALTVPH
jgi:hypothetical protein